MPGSFLLLKESRTPGSWLRGFDVLRHALPYGAGLIVTEEGARIDQIRRNILTLAPQSR